MKIAIFGVSGQLGSDVAAALSSHRVDAVDHTRADIRDAADVERVLGESSPDWAVNCAAMTHVDACETDALQAFATNALGTRNIARACAAAGARFLHVSTDYVFDGALRRPYVESDPPRPINAYGMSKLAGEWFAMAEYPAGATIVRTSGLYGTHVCRGKGTNFVETMLARAAAGGPLRVVTDETLTPTFTVDLAQQIRTMIEAGVPAGIYHATNGGECSWHAFASEAVRLAGIDVDVQPMRAAEWKSPARRPANSVLENRALDTLGLNMMPDWRDALARYIALRAPAPRHEA
ncbi:MAG TPA: dTDP-4-dehydrorhamnose reductase [Candidatus Krumholzibacteria bacterium]|nr:dTDP-4-dehydrorhamnose reductase [Candidatus Krumholzibacteria bacterium]